MANKTDIIGGLIFCIVGIFLSVLNFKLFLLVSLACFVVGVRLLSRYVGYTIERNLRQDKSENK